MPQRDGKRKRVSKRMAKKDRRNLRLWAEGVRETILKPHIAGYTDALERGWRAERDYVKDVCNEFHARISWRLADDEEPDTPVPNYDKFAMPVVEEMDEEETTRKRLRIEQMNARIGRWLKYRARRLQRPTRMDRTRDPWAILLAKLAGINSPPKARQAFQQYMHESYDEEIAPAVQARWAASCVDEDGVTLRKKAPDAPFRAKEVVSCWLASTRTGGREGAKEARDAYFAAMKGPPSRAPADRQRCIDNLGGFMSAILRGVSEYTGLHGVVIFGGPIPQFGGEIRTVTYVALVVQLPILSNKFFSGSHMGEIRGPNPCHFAHWAKARFNRDVLEFMKEFLRTAFTPAMCAEAALPDEDLLGKAQYTMPNDAVHNAADAIDLDGLADSDSDDSDSDSESDSDVETELEEDVRNLKGKLAAKKNSKTAAEKENKGKGKGKEVAASNEGGRKRKRGQENESDRAKAAKKRAVASGSKESAREDEDEDEDGEASDSQAATLAPHKPTMQEERAVNMARNKAALDELNRQYMLAHPEYAREVEESRARRENGAKPRAKSKAKPKARAAPRRSGRLSGDTETGNDDVNMPDAQPLPPPPEREDRPPTRPEPRRKENEQPPPPPPAAQGPRTDVNVSATDLGQQQQQPPPSPPPPPSFSQQQQPPPSFPPPPPSFSQQPPPPS
ncbi:hypothetical protein C8R47DRAFT_1082673, partial [Mycena vitilis]